MGAFAHNGLAHRPARRVDICKPVPAGTQKPGWTGRNKTPRVVLPSFGTLIASIEMAENNSRQRSPVSLPLTSFYACGPSHTPSFPCVYCPPPASPPLPRLSTAKFPSPTGTESLATQTYTPSFQPSSVPPSPCSRSGDDSSSDSKPVRQRPRPARVNGEGHCNKPYTLEQRLFINYHRVELKLKWKDVSRAFNRRFPDGPRRNSEGCNSLSYRKNGNEIPELTRDDLLVLDESSDVRYDGVGYRVRYNSAGQIRRIGEVGVIKRHPKKLVEGAYDWVRPEHMEQARRMGMFCFFRMTHVHVPNAYLGSRLPALSALTFLPPS